MLDSSATRQAGAPQGACRLLVLGEDREPIEWDDGRTYVLRFLRMKCLTHGAEWRNFVGGTTSLPCTMQAWVYSAVEQSEEESQWDSDGDASSDDGDM